MKQSSIFIVLCLMCLALTAEAQTVITIPADSYLDQASSSLKAITDGWYNFIALYAKRLFWILVAADFSYWALMNILQQQDLFEFAKGIVTKMLTILFFWGLLLYSNTWVPQIISSFENIAGGIDGSGAQFTPGAMVGLGDDIFTAAQVKMTSLHWDDKIALALPLFLVTCASYFCCLFMGISFFIVKIESFIALSGGVILLGFGGSRFSREYVNTYLKYVVSVGLKLMFMLLLLITAYKQVTAAIGDPNATSSADDLTTSAMRVLGICVVYLMVLAAIPKIVGGLMGGGPTLGMAEASGMAITGAAAGGAVLAGAMVAAGGAGDAVKKALGSGAKASSESMPLGSASAVRNAVAGGGAAAMSGASPILGSVIGGSDRSSQSASSGGVSASNIGSGSSPSSSTGGKSEPGSAGASDVTSQGMSGQSQGGSAGQQDPAGSSRADVPAPAGQPPGSATSATSSSVDASGNKTEGKIESATASPSSPIAQGDGKNSDRSGGVISGGAPRPSGVSAGDRPNDRDGGSGSSSASAVSASMDAGRAAAMAESNTNNAPSGESTDSSAGASASNSQADAQDSGANTSAAGMARDVAEEGRREATENFISGQGDGANNKANPAKDAGKEGGQKTNKSGIVQSAKQAAQNIKSLEGFVLDDRASMGGGGFHMPGHEE